MKAGAEPQEERRSRRRLERSGPTPEAEGQAEAEPWKMVWGWQAEPGRLMRMKIHGCLTCVVTANACVSEAPRGGRTAELFMQLCRNMHA
jgi:hypothetical protein